MQSCFAHIWHVFKFVFYFISGSLPHHHKVVIAGNHELTFDPTFMTQGDKRSQLKSTFNVDPEDMDNYLKKNGLSNMKEMLTNCTYLEDSETTVCGIHIYGSPW